MSDPTVILLFMFLGLSIGILIMQLISIYGEKIPYTVVLFIFGIVLSISAEKCLGAWTQSIDDWVNIDADIMLFVFLPPLIFAEAMNLNWHHTKNALAQASLLAGPGVLFGTAALGCLVKLLTPGWSWNLCMVFGAVLGATDTVAVVALMKSQSTSPKLTMIIVGESLMNDGTSMVIFTLLFNMLCGRTYTVGNIVAFFVEAAIGSCLVGAIFGLVTLRWLRSANRPLKETDVFIQIAITLCCAYLSFFVAQYGLEISGILSCAGAGLVLAILAPPIILNHQTMHSVWAMIEWIGNTLIFLLAGLIIGHRTIQHVDVIDWLFCFVLYLGLMVIRVATVGLLYPWLRKYGHKCTFNEAVFISWAGLRGALPLALALLVKNSDEAGISESDSSKFFFYVGGVAACSLLINATFTSNVLRALGLSGNETLEKEMVMNQIKKRLRKKVNKMIDDLGGHLHPDGLNEIRASCSLLRNVDDTRDIYRITNVADSHRGNSNNASARSSVYVSSMFSCFNIFKSGSSDIDTDRATISRMKSGDRAKSVTQVNMLVSKSLSTCKSTNQNTPTSSGLIPELLLYVRTVFLEIVRVKYWQLIEVGKMPRLSHSAQYLLYSIDVGVDSTNASLGLKDFGLIEDEINTRPSYHRCLLSIEDYIKPTLSYTVGKLEARKEKRSVYMLTSFIEAHEHAQGKIHDFVGVEEDDENYLLQTPEELKVVAESKVLVAKAKQMLAMMHPQTVAAIKTKQAAKIILSKQAELVIHMMQEGLLSSQHAEEFLDEISKDSSNIEHQRNKMYREQANASALHRASTFRGNSFISQSNNTTQASKQHQQQHQHSLDIISCDLSIGVLDQRDSVYLSLLESE